MKNGFYRQARVIEQYEALLRRYSAELRVPFTPLPVDRAAPGRGPT